MEDAKMKAILDTVVKTPHDAARALKLAVFDACVKRTHKEDYSSLQQPKEDYGPRGYLQHFGESDWDTYSLKDLKGLHDEIKKIKDDATNNPFAKNYSYADLYQFLGVVAINKLAKNDKFLTYGGHREDCKKEEFTSMKLHFPEVKKDTPPSVIKEMFYPMHFKDEEIVALSWAYQFWETREQQNQAPGQQHEDDRPILNNDFFKKLDKNEPNVYHWDCLRSDSGFHKIVNTFSKDNEKFINAFKNAHARFTNLDYRKLIQAEERKGMMTAIVATILVGLFGVAVEFFRK